MKKSSCLQIRQSPLAALSHTKNDNLIDLECRVIPGKLGKVAVCSGNQEEPGWTNCAIPRGPGEARGGREAGKVTGQVSEGARHREVGGRTFCVSCEAVFKMFYIMLPIIP